VTSAAIAAITERVGIRAGSVVLPLHSTLRVAEEWSVVDNLSRGRVGISVASGWHANDFVLAPGNYADRRERMYREVETLRRLWRGEALTCRGGEGREVAVKILPRPVQAELPVWITAAGSPETFRMAGEIGAGLLTHLLGQSVEGVAEKIAIYREAWKQHGHGPGEGHVTLMLHTFVGEDLDAVREMVREPFCSYLRTSIDLIKNFGRWMGREIDPAQLSPDDLDALVSHAFDRYFETSGLFGTPESCLGLISQLAEAGVDEVACLIDFGVPFDAVMEGLTHLNTVRERWNAEADTSPADAGADRSAPLPEEHSIAVEIARHEVTHLQCTPSMARMLTVDPEALAALRGLKVLMLGGEALPVALLEQLEGTVSGRIHNMYGPTETTIWSTTYAGRARGSSVPIGRPIANTQIYLLDRRLQPVPLGVPGELFIGGDGVTRGYLRRPELTQERFIPDPFSAAPGARLYRTGDLARYLEEGDIEFLGRLDYQVKIRGHRIELGEIEARLEQHSEVREAVVVARDDETGEKRLIAYYVTKEPDQKPSWQELRDFLREELSEAMLPAAFVRLEAMPLTPNGKVDRKALPAPDLERPELQQEYLAPRDEAEEALARIWRQVLGLEQVGVHDNFFDLGGDSILAVQIVARANQARLKFSIRQLMERQTIAELAPVVQHASVGLQEGPISGPVRLTPIQQWLLEQDLPELDHYSQVMLLTTRDGTCELDAARLEAAMRELVRHHDALRLRFTRSSAGWEQAIALPGEDTPLLLCRELSGGIDSPEDEAAAVQAAVAELQERLNLSHGPLFQSARLRFGPGRPERLVLVAHHLAIDGVSWRILLEDLEAAYRALSRGERIRLPSRSTSFQRWASCLVEHAQSPAVRREADYWLAAAQGPEGIALPTDFPGGANTVGSGQRVTRVLPADETRRLLHEAHAAYQTRTGDLLLTALAQTFAAWTGDRRLRVDLEGHGREEIGAEVEVSRTVGWFTTIFPVLVEPGSAQRPGDALKSVKEQLRAVPNNGIGYGLLRYLHEDTKLRHELAQLKADLLFNYLGQFGQLGADNAGLLAPDPEGPGPLYRDASPRQARSHLIEIVAIVVDEELKLMWHYSENVHRRSTIETLADQYTAHLSALIAHCCGRTEREYTPTDFPLARLNQEKLEKVLAQLKGTRKS
jgi:natural product biosynthesis luciferase-like monooxygenase protein/non-ribosomal peptide synthase protein (TIGR01720 family)